MKKMIFKEFGNSGIKRFIAFVLVIFLAATIVLPGIKLDFPSNAKAESTKAHFVGYTYYYNEDGSFNAGSGMYTVDGKRAYCIEHAKYSVTGESLEDTMLRLEGGAVHG